MPGPEPAFPQPGQDVHRVQAQATDSTLVSLTIPNSTGTANIVDLKSIPTDSIPFTFRDPGTVTPNNLRVVWQILDYLGSQITGIKNDGGQFWTDSMAFLHGSPIVINGVTVQSAYWPQIREAYLNQNAKRGPALIFSFVGPGGGAVIDHGQSITIDVGNETFIRLDDNNRLEASVPFRSGTGSTAYSSIGAVGPSGEYGIQVVPFAGNNPVYLYRRTANTWTTPNNFEVNGTLSVGGALVGLLGSGQPAATTTNSVTETQLLSQTITGAISGYHYRLRVFGTLTNSSAGAVTYQAKVKIGGNTIVTSDAISEATGANTKRWDMDIDLFEYIDTAHQDVRMRWLISNGSTNNAPNFPTGSAGGAIGGGFGTVDMTANPALSVTMTMGTADPAASFTVLSWYLERIS